MSNDLQIHLNKTDFTGGEVVTGELELKVDAPIPVRGIRVLLHGYEQSYWGRGSGRVRSSGTGRVRTTHSQTRDLFNEEITLFGDPPLDTAALISDSFTGLFSSGHYHTLEPGSYSYSFSFTLPEDLPGDYEDSTDRSKIRYLVKGYLDIPLKIDIEQTVQLTIHETHDPAASQPVSVSSEKTLFEAGTSVKMKADMEKNVFLTGEILDCRLMVDNQSGKEIQAVTVTLQKAETLSAQGASTVNIEEVHTKRYDQISIATGDSTDLNLQFELPGDVYPSIVSSELVQVEYRLCCALEIPWASGFDIPWAMDLDVEVPIVLIEETNKTAGMGS